MAIETDSMALENGSVFLWFGEGVTDAAEAKAIIMDRVREGFLRASESNHCVPKMGEVCNDGR